MTKVYQCDRCKTIFEPRLLAYGEPYITRKGKADLDLCPKCYNLFTDFIKANDIKEMEKCIAEKENLEKKVEFLKQQIRLWQSQPTEIICYDREDEEAENNAWIDFASFVAKEVCDDNFKENADSFAELACRKLVKLGLVELDGDTYKYVKTRHEEGENE